MWHSGQALKGILRLARQQPQMACGPSQAVEQWNMQKWVPLAVPEQTTYTHARA